MSPGKPDRSAFVSEVAAKVRRQQTAHVAEPGPGPGVFRSGNVSGAHLTASGSPHGGVDPDGVDDCCHAELVRGHGADLICIFLHVRAEMAATGNVPAADYGAGPTVMTGQPIGAPERPMRASAVSRPVFWRSAAAM